MTSRVASCARFIGLLGCIVSCTGDALAQQRALRRNEEPPNLLRPRSGAAIADLELVETSVGRSTERRHPVTDFAVRLKARPELPISVALTLENGDPRVRRRAIFQMELMLVSGGRLLIEERAECRAWQGDISICQTECDGGQFAVVRTRGATRPRLKLMLGALPDIDRDSLSQGVRIGACSEQGDADMSIGPRRGVRQVEIEVREP